MRCVLTVFGVIFAINLAVAQSEPDPLYFKSADRPNLYVQQFNGSKAKSMKSRGEMFTQYSGRSINPEYSRSSEGASDDEYTAQYFVARYRAMMPSAGRMMINSSRYFVSGYNPLVMNQTSENFRKAIRPGFSFRWPTFRRQRVTLKDGR